MTEQITYGPKTSVNGQVFNSPKGFYWYVEITIEGCGNEHIAIDSRKAEKYFMTRDHALSDLNIEGKNMVSMIEKEWTEKLGAKYCDIIDRTKMT